jgi:hypothetical protein
MPTNAQDSWERFLTPEILRSNLINASIFIASFEILKTSIVERIRDFNTNGFNENRLIIDPSYERDILSKHKNPLSASLLWLKDNDVISAGDIALFDEIKKCRNIIAHEITRLLVEGLPVDFSERFNDMVALLDKIEKWWVVNVDIPTGMYFGEKEINENDIIPGPIASLRMMIDVALGTDEEAEYYLKELKNNGFFNQDQNNPE